MQIGGWVTYCKVQRLGNRIVRLDQEGIHGNATWKDGLDRGSDCQPVNLVFICSDITRAVPELPALVGGRAACCACIYGRAATQKGDRLSGAAVIA